MKQRLIVMNGQRIVQSVQGDQWHNEKVERANGVKPGVYNIFTSSQADKTKAYAGVILYTDKTRVYQQVGKSYVIHNRADFDKVPEVGLVKSISYDASGKAVVGAAVSKISLGLSR